MASDLISRKALINKFWEYTNGGKQRYLIPEDIWEMVELEPTVDAVEVVHGEWKMYNNKTLFARTLVCSNCNHNRVVSGDNPAYCEKCGAKMDGGDKE